jgi:hypothetical protein
MFWIRATGFCGQSVVTIDGFLLMRRSFLKGLANRLGYVCIRKVVSNLKGCSLLDGTN